MFDLKVYDKLADRWPDVGDVTKSMLKWNPYTTNEIYCVISCWVMRRTKIDFAGITASVYFRCNRVRTRIYTLRCAKVSHLAQKSEQANNHYICMATFHSVQEVPVLQMGILLY